MKGIAKRESGPASKSEKFLIILSFAEASILEIESVIARDKMPASIEKGDRTAALINCDEATARALIRRVGGSYKIARCLGNSSNSIKEVDTPFEAKFNWTVSGYECSDEIYSQARAELHELLKAKGLGKSKFLQPDISSRPQKGGTVMTSEELRVGYLRERVLLKDLKNPGIDLIVHGGFSGSYPIYAQTIEALDIGGYDSRDFDRPFQDPTKTVSPRLARILVNISIRRESRSLLDPFCGLGTVLQEALLSGLDLIGVDRDQSLVQKSRANLSWLISTRGIGTGSRINLFAYDARRISKARMPIVDAIASEPLLVPVFLENPPIARAIDSIEKARSIYERSLQQFSSVLSRKGSRIAITSPALIDASGKTRTFDITSTAEDCGLKPYFGSFLASERMSYPFRLETRKKKTVQRNLNVFYLA